ncbi:iron chelate uptake ABC transporter family permease subunit [Rhodococcus hoagii]|uniref:ABC transporter integral membrane subunit n=1 Tax=Rhodococcus hoagii (strain 103S) TaxID=685727 RepID=A0A3S5Y3X5_RHOH1|nr:iron ABC transporter permease [Prescottella equi]MCD7049428.1 iron ABC transporter permease [Rhodococcus sp. BH2-1]GBF14147.1 hemin transport system permease protein HmuU [Rhodococcus sp. Br-6]MBM4470117.1 iron chelate uptake ABC transporter family permease subunit [Prescottella equi]MBM4524269.1 iron chelate uptake ABC transporter family permease subunit [Prescottella equi]MBM4555620.1 iron chelate uptake ABC transporter family permease subunit [Prescottella equi]
MNRTAATVTALAAFVVAATILAVSVGSVTIPFGTTARYLFTGDAGSERWTTLIADIRLPRVVTAACAGAALAVAGLLMQTLFANPLADPYILGVSSGASLGVALVVLGSGTGAGVFAAVAGTGRLGVAAAAAIGALAVLLLVLAISRWIRSVVTLLIVGVMVGSVTSAIVSLLVAFSQPAQMQQFVLWSLGSYAGASWSDLRVLVPAVLVGVVFAATLVRPLNAMLLGEDYAHSMGVHLVRTRTIAITASALLAGAVTAFCGPIAFLGIAVPHLARLALGTSDHRILLPGVVLMGAGVSLLCSVVAQLPGRDGVLPLNVVTALVGAPVVILVLLRSRRAQAGTVS